MSHSVQSSTSQHVEDLQALLASMGPTDSGGDKMNVDDVSALGEDSNVGMTELFRNHPPAPTGGELPFKQSPVVQFKKVVNRGKEYPLFVVPEEDEMKKHCFGLIGSGQTFCLGVNCRIPAHARAKNLVSPGEGYVMKSRTVAFERPFIQFELLDPDTQALWRQQSHPLETWSEWFAASRNVVEQEGSPKRINEFNIATVVEEKRNLLELKTPAKRRKIKTDSGSTINALLISKLSNEIIVEPSLEVKIQPQELYTTLKIVESHIKSLEDFIFQLHTEVNTQGDTSHAFSRATDEKIEALNLLMGKKPQLLDPEINANDIWGVLGNISDSIAGSVSEDDIRGIRTLIEQARAEAESNVLNLNAIVENNKIEILNTNNQFQTITTQLFNNFNYKLNTLRESLNNVSKSPKVNLAPSFNTTPKIGSSQFQTTNDDEINELKQEILAMKSELTLLKNSNDKEFVRYHNLGFTNFTEAQAWITLKGRGTHFGLIVDFHTVMENVFNLITGQDILAKMYNVFKIKLCNMSQASSMTSFECELPKFFSENFSC